jgi:predicted DNA-binding transcriptional regulator AlpA
MSEAHPRETRKLTARAVAARYGVVVRTVDRWTESGILPKPKYICGRRYWDRDEVDERDRTREDMPCGFAQWGGRVT